MQAQDITTIENIQSKYGMAVLSRVEPKKLNVRARVVVFHEPITGDETHDVKPAVAVRRLLLPYCKITDGDREYLLNREYNPIWVRHLGGSAVRSPVRSSMPGETVWFYNDGTPEPKRVAVGRRVCASWGIALPDRLADLVVSA